jgi:hypothetical protein
MDIFPDKRHHGGRDFSGKGKGQGKKRQDQGEKAAKAGRGAELHGEGKRGCRPPVLHEMDAGGPGWGKVFVS